MSTTLEQYQRRFPSGPASVQRPTVTPPVAEVAAALSEVEKLVDDERQARDQLARAEEAYHAAREADLRRGADALRSGKREPAPAASEKAKQELERAKWRLEKVQAAGAASHSDLLSAIGAHRVELVERLQGDARDLLEQTRQAVQQADSLKQRRLGVLQCLRWVEDPHRAGGLQRTPLRSALMAAVTAAEQAAEPAESAEARPNEWTLARRFRARVREIEKELVNGGADRTSAHQRAVDQATAEAETPAERAAREGRRLAEGGLIPAGRPMETAA
jgi:hypothetical protein